MRRHLPWLVAVITWLCTVPPVTAQTARFVDDRFEDFSKGTLGSGGQNLYVARDGSLRTINRFDLNNDGYLDLVFNCTHDTYQMLPATVGTVSKARRVSSGDLAVEGSQRVALGDLDRDGYTDVVISPNAIGVHHDRRFLSIAWGDPRGWSARRITSALPMNRADRLALVDLDHDGWLDIAVLGATRWMATQPPGRIIRVFRGGEPGFSADRRFDLGVENAIDLAAGDFDGDGAADLAVLRSDSRITIIWADKSVAALPRSDVVLPRLNPLCLASGHLNDDRQADLVVGTDRAVLLVLKPDSKRSWGDVHRVTAPAASQISIGDLDGDDNADLVLTRFSTARAAGGEQAGTGRNARDAVIVLWGHPRGFLATRSTRLNVDSAVATAIGDLDDDGQADIAVAVHQGQHTFNGTSFAWYGDGRRRFTRSKDGFKTSGTTDVAIARPEADLPPRVVFCNSIGGRHDEAVPVHVYWGGKDGFDPARVWKIPFQSGYESSAADLNADGFVDLILMNSGHAHSEVKEHSGLGANIFWGGPDGFDLEKRRSVIDEHFLGSSSVADLDRDGRLDLVLEPFAPEKPGQVDQLMVYYGTDDGFDVSRRTRIPKPGYSQEHALADLNDDGWLDIAHTSRSENYLRILWGGRRGFDASRSQRLKLAGALGLSIADLDADGRLDLVGSTYADPIEGPRDMGSLIFWGHQDGYRHSRAQWLPGFSPIGRTVADFDGDGHLDLFSPQHTGEFTREDLACHIYWGSATGFHTRRRTTLFCDSVNDSLAGDFNGDGKLDLAVACHTQHGNHRVFSRVFYNDGRRFANPRMTKLPTNGTHLMWANDLGNIADRRYRETFVSRPFAWKDRATRGRITVQAQSPRGTRLALAIRSAANRASLDGQEWRSFEKARFPLPAGDRVIQYRAVFRSDNGDRYPVLDRVEIELTP